MKKLINFLFLTLLLACGSPHTDDEVQPIDRSLVFKNIFDEAIVPAHEFLIVATEKLYQQAQLFEASPNTVELEKFRSLWIDARIKWAHVELYNMGEVNNSFAHYRLNRYPVNAEKLEEHLEYKEALDLDFVKNSGSNTVGFAALEYLLFKDSKEASAVLAERSGSLPKYSQYLSALANYLNTESQSLLDKINEMESDWTAETDMYAMNQLVNAYVALIETVKNNKVGKPSGLYGSQGENPNLVECPYSDISLDVLTANLQEIEKTFEAGGNTNMYALVDQVQEGLKGSSDLSPTIKQVLTESIENIKSMPLPLKEMVIQQPLKVAGLNSQLHDLLLAVKVDMANLFGVTVVFNDNDGD